MNVAFFDLLFCTCLPGVSSLRLHETRVENIGESFVTMRISKILELRRKVGRRKEEMFGTMEEVNNTRNGGKQADIHKL